MLFKTVEIEGLKIFYREAGNPRMPKLVLLHGFPASSHQYRNLMTALSDEFHIVSPDYPGFGNSDIPDPCRFRSRRWYSTAPTLGNGGSSAAG